LGQRDSSELMSFPNGVNVIGMGYDMIGLHLDDITDRCRPLLAIGQRDQCVLFKRPVSAAATG
jgi:hypothetical protein